MHEAAEFLRAEFDMVRQPMAVVHQYQMVAAGLRPAHDFAGGNEFVVPAVDDAGGNRSGFVKDKKFVSGGSLGTSASSVNGPTVKDMKCFQCQGIGHMARECTKAYVPRGRK